MLKKATLVTLIILTISTASGFQMQIKEQAQPATPQQGSTINIQVENTADQTRTYKPDLLNNRYQFLYIASQTQKIPPGQKENFTITVTPGETVLNGNYEYNMKITEQETGISKIETGIANVERQNDLQLVYTNTNQENYQPGETITLEAEIKNYGTRTIQNYNITAQTLNQTQTKKGLDINRRAERRYSFRFPTKNQTPPGNHEIQLTLQRNNQKQQLGTETINIEEKPIIKVKESTSNRLISSTTTKTITNEGNTPKNHTIRTQLNPFLEPITTFNHQPTQTENKESQITYTHTLEVKPGETQQLQTTTQYWKPAAALIILIGLIALISNLREDIKFQKTAKSSENGIKVQIEIENNSNQLIENLKIKDSVPNIAKVEENFPMAKPKIRKKSEGTELTWEIDELEPSSQRVLEYTIKPVVEVEEGAKLTKAKLYKNDQKIKESKEIETTFKP